MKVGDTVKHTKCEISPQCGMIGLVGTVTDILHDENTHLCIWAQLGDTGTSHVFSENELELIE